MYLLSSRLSGRSQDKLGKHMLTLFIVIPLLWLISGQAWEVDFEAIYGDRAHFADRRHTKDTQGTPTGHTGGHAGHKGAHTGHMEGHAGHTGDHTGHKGHTQDTREAIQDTRLACPCVGVFQTQSGSSWYGNWKLSSTSVSISI